MNFQLDKYIFPITDSGVKDGVGVVVGNKLITAGHVVNGMDTFSIKIDEKNYRVTKNQILALSILSDKPEPTDYDICVFELAGINSPLTMATEMPNLGKQLLSISYKHTSKAVNSGDGNNIFNKLPEENREIHHSVASVNKKETNFFGCDMREPLEEGRSGSPIFADGKVYGILTGGIDKGKFCFFQSSKSILEFLKIHNIKV